MMSSLEPSKTREVLTEADAALLKGQPWRAFIREPEIRPFSTDDGEVHTIIRLKSEKDEHGLGG